MKVNDISLKWRILLALLLVGVGICALFKIYYHLCQNAKEHETNTIAQYLYYDLYSANNRVESPTPPLVRFSTQDMDNENHDLYNENNTVESPEPLLTRLSTHDMEYRDHDLYGENNRVQSHTLPLTRLSTQDRKHQDHEIYSETKIVESPEPPLTKLSTQEIESLSPTHLNASENISAGLNDQVVPTIGLLTHQSSISDGDSRPSLWLADEFQVFSQYEKAHEQCYMAPSMAEDRRRDKNRLRIANFNVDWLFFFGGANTEEFTCPGKCTWKTHKDAWNHIKDVASAIQELDADIIHLTEVEDCRVLGILCDLLGSDYRPYLILGTDLTTHQNVGLISRIDPSGDLLRIDRTVKFPVQDSKCDPVTSGVCSLPKNYIAQFEIANGAEDIVELIIGGAHFRAGINNPAACMRREAQAHVLTAGVQRHSQEQSRIVLMGDFNDTDPRLPQIGVQNSAPSNALRILASQAGKNLYNPLIQVPPDQGHTQQTGSALDHILVDQRLWVSNTKVHHEAGRATMRNSRVSDHYPLVVEIDLRSQE